jgi:lipopolysaccharide export system protein LptA
MNKGRWIGLLVIILSLSLFLMPGKAQEKKGAVKGGEKRISSSKGFGFTTTRAPIDITSDTVEGDQKQNIITFRGNVVAKQENATLYANLLVVHYDGETRKLKEIVATGNVKVVQLNRRATCQRATFFQNENKIVLDGDAVVREGDNVIRGERVVYFVDEERSFVEGGKGSRVTTTIVPSSKEERKK